jgi:hypothetical protein
MPPGWVEHLSGDALFVCLQYKTEGPRADLSSMPQPWVASSRMNRPSLLKQRLLFASIVNT